MASHVKTEFEYLRKTCIFAETVYEHRLTAYNICTMRNFLLILLSLVAIETYAADILVEAENFDTKGGWVVDQQFMDFMGSPYLLAHGMGVPVPDAVTSVDVPEKGTYHVYVRTFNWTSPWSSQEGPGKFNVRIGDTVLPETLGCQGDRWMWQYAGKIRLQAGETELALVDLTGFDGRCDAVYLTTEREPSLPDGIADLDAFRRDRLGLGDPGEESFDFVVVGGGIAGMCAAVAAARDGVKVALVNDRPVLGGNNSAEVRVHLGGYVEMGPNEGLGRMIREFGHTKKGNAQPASNYEDDRKQEFIDAEENITLFANYHATAVRMDGDRIEAVLVRHIETGEEHWLSAPLFSDCTGDGTIGYLAGAECMMGRESRDTFGEFFAPETADSTTMGSSIQWYSKDCGAPTTFPEFDYGMGFNSSNCEKVTMGEWHWETGMNLDQIYDAERIRDYGMLVIYANWSCLKNHLENNEKWRNRSLDWVGYILGKRESRRIVGDHILTQNDIDRDIPYEDASFTTTWAIDLHFPDPVNSGRFPGREFKAATVHNWIHPYAVPYRCLYARDIENMFMAGRNISVSHVALGTVRVMRTTGMMGEVVGMAASLCKEYGCTPREIYLHHLDELKSMMKEGAGKRGDGLNNQLFNLPNTLLDKPKAAPYSEMKGDTLVIGNRVIERKFIWNGGNLMTYSLTDKKTGVTHYSADLRPDFSVVKGTGAGTDDSYSVEDIPADEIHEAYQKTVVTYSLGDLQVRREFRVYMDVPAIACDTWLRGTLTSDRDGKTLSAADRKNIEFAEDTKSEPLSGVLDQLRFDGLHWHGKAVEFWDVTDWNNNLVAERDFIPYRRTSYRGNLLFVRDGVSGNGFFFLKESPSSGSQLAYPGADFVTEFGNFSVTGMGLKSSDITPDAWTQAYSCVTGVYGQGELSALTALRKYQKQLRRHIPGRDEMVMMNTWGDRSQDTKVNEAFCLAELEKAARLGITHFQIDDGWQVGKSPNSALAKGSFKDIYDNPDYWKPDPVKYPSGLAPIVKKAEELGIVIGLWFNPSVQNDFADWRKDADAILSLYREYGIRVFKIDGLAVASKQAEENLRRLFDTVQKESGNEVIFNLDVTAGRRPGYHSFYEYGNVFLENRYTDWHLYFPYWTLRNVWQLSEYVPAERLQVEFLNKWRNAELYGDDPFAPSKLPFDYIFATSMAGQPLAWMEASNLPEEAYGIAGLVEDYRKVSADFHSGTILPIGEEPSGRSFTGFQSLKEGSTGYVIVYREDTCREKASMRTWLPEGSSVSFEPVLGYGEAFRATAGMDGMIEFSLPDRHTFAMYYYSIKK